MPCKGTCSCCQNSSLSLVLESTGNSLKVKEVKPIKSCVELSSQGAQVITTCTCCAQNFFNTNGKLLFVSDTYKCGCKIDRKTFQKSLPYDHEQDHLKICAEPNYKVVQETILTFVEKLEVSSKLKIPICFFCDSPYCQCHNEQITIKCVCRIYIKLKDLQKHFVEKTKCYHGLWAKKINIYSQRHFSLNATQRNKLIKLIYNNDRCCLEVNSNVIQNYCHALKEFFPDIQFYLGGRNFKRSLQHLEGRNCVVDYRGHTFSMYEESLRTSTFLIVLYIK